MKQKTKEELLGIIQNLKNKSSMYTNNAECAETEFKTGYQLLALELRVVALELSGIIKDA